MVFSRHSRVLILLVCCGCFIWGFASIVIPGTPADLYNQRVQNGVARAIALSPTPSPTPSPSPTPPWTTEERLRRIEAMGQRIDGYVQFMCQVGSLNGTSAEAKERAVAAFYERLVIVESQLGRMHDSLRLE